MKGEVFSIENAKIVFRNFSGKEGRFNPAGRRNFSVLLAPDFAQQLLAQGWNVKFLNPREDGDIPQAHLSVRVAYNAYPPKIILITSRGKTVLNEEDVNILDWAEIANADLIIRPYTWEVQGKQGISAYLKAAYITIVEDEFERKYADCPDVPDSAQNVVGENQMPW